MIKEIYKMPVSITIILVWIVVWILAATKNIAPALSGKGIAQIGNEYYRFFTAGLTHTAILHLLINACAMFWVGYLYERRIGSIKFLLVAVLCAIISQIIFLCIYRNTASSIGGSAFNFALCGFGLTLQLLIPNFPKMVFGTWSGSWLILYLIGSNIPVLSFMNITTVIFHAIAFGVGVIAALISWLLGMR